MSRLFFLIMLLVFCMYVLYTQTLIKNYDKMNDSLIASIDNLLHSCVPSNLNADDGLPYK